MGLLPLAIACGVVSAILVPVTNALHIVFATVFFGYASFFAVGAKNSTWYYATAANFYGMILAYFMVKLVPLFGGNPWGLPILVFFLATLYVMGANFEWLSKAYCTFFGGVSFFTTGNALPTASPENILGVTITALIIGYISGFISINIPELLNKNKETVSAPNA